MGRQTYWVVIAVLGFAGQLAQTQTPVCSDHGTMEKGMCVCDEDYMGVNCSVNKIDNCKKPGDNSVCSGHGYCMDGTCLCQSRGDDLHRFSGRYCECDERSCPYFEDDVCGGRGRCDCGTCRCYEGFTGDDCSCTTVTDNCVADDGRICNGNGNCRCNECICIKGYGGPTCSDKQNMEQPKSSMSVNDRVRTQSKSFMSDLTEVCNLLTPCVLCVGFHSGEKDKEECDEDCNMNRLHIVEKLPDSLDNRVCRHTDTDECVVTFSHTDESFYAMSVYIQDQKDFL
ncbi:integrin beta-3-like [Argopecten irradians]|uniref:integrin beta-3-like n=1 Tax=Argopecten irradians TaxID=31199 RepID=UPI003721F7AB